MTLRKNITDGCLLISIERRARCCACAKWLESGARAWSYLPNPVDGNYVECGPCRYGFPCDLNNHGEAVRLVCTAA